MKINVQQLQKEVDGMLSYVKECEPNNFQRMIAERLKAVLETLRHGN